MTDEEIQTELKAAAREFCKVLNLAGRAGLNIDVKFGFTERIDGSDGTQLLNWRSYTTLSRIYRS